MPSQGRRKECSTNPKEKTKNKSNILILLKFVSYGVWSQKRKNRNKRKKRRNEKKSAAPASEGDTRAKKADIVSHYEESPAQDKQVAIRAKKEDIVADDEDSPANNDFKSSSQRYESCCKGHQNVCSLLCKFCLFLEIVYGQETVWCCEEFLSALFHLVNKNQELHILRLQNIAGMREEWWKNTTSGNWKCFNRCVKQMPYAKQISLTQYFTRVCDVVWVFV